jgi:FlaA1/EpsC-like NDP-sugar epimerase
VPLYRGENYSKIGEIRYKRWLRSVWHTGALFLGTIALCTLGLYILHSPGVTSDTRLLDALWNAANTISTLGSLSNLNDAQRAFMIVAMLSLVGVAGYALTSLAGALSREDIEIYLENRRTAKIISKLKGHLILTGFGSTGRIIAEKLRAAGETVVVLDHDPDVSNLATNLGYITVQASISKDGVLEQVNIDDARALIVAVSDPDRMLAATLMARMLNPKLLICTAADSTNRWLIRAGASEVVFRDEVVSKEIATRLEAASK